MNMELRRPPAVLRENPPPAPKRTFKHIQTYSISYFYRMIGRILLISRRSLLPTDITGKSIWRLVGKWSI